MRTISRIVWSDPFYNRGLHAYLSQLNLSEADRVLFIADGAPWIWNRVAELVKKLGLEPDQVYQLIDFYHAVKSETINRYNFIE